MKVFLLFILLAGTVFGDVVHRIVPDGSSIPDSQEFYDADPDAQGYLLFHTGHEPRGKDPFFALDLDKNGVEDFRIIAMGLLDGQWLEGRGPNAAAQSHPSDGFHGSPRLAALPPGEWVGPVLPENEVWAESFPGVLNQESIGIMNCSDPPFIGIGRICNGMGHPRFLQPGGAAYGGLRFEIDGSTHYGWVRLKDRGEALTGEALYIQAYAYESEPDTPIRIIPEPSTAGLLGAGALLLFLMRSLTQLNRGT